MFEPTMAVPLSARSPSPFLWSTIKSTLGWNDGRGSVGGGTPSCRPGFCLSDLPTLTITLNKKFSVAFHSFSSGSSLHAYALFICTWYLSYFFPQGFSSILYTGYLSYFYLHMVLFFFAQRALFLQIVPFSFVAPQKREMVPGPGIFFLFSLRSAYSCLRMLLFFLAVLDS